MDSRAEKPKKLKFRSERFWINLPARQQRAKGLDLLRRFRSLACLGFIFGGRPYVLFDVHAGLTERHTFGLKQFALQAGIRFANQQFSAIADNAMPGNAFSGGACGHRTASTAGSSAEPESFRKSPVGDNPSTRNSFHKRIYRSPRHFFFRPVFPSDRQVARWYHQIARWHAMEEDSRRHARVEIFAAVLNRCGESMPVKNSRYRKEMRIREINGT